jgi:glutaredoxin
MKLYVCWGTMGTPRPGGHPCKNAHDALKEAGHDFEMERGYGWTVLPDVPFNMTHGRKRAKELTGSNSLPVLELDDGTGIGGSDKIIAWAKANPA